MARAILDNYSEQMMIYYDLYGAILYGLLLKATGGETGMAGRMLTDIFCNVHKVISIKSSDEKLTLLQILVVAGVVLKQHQISVDLKSLIRSERR